MRILFTCHNITSHLGALLPVIRAAERATHTVAVAAPLELGPRLAEHGLEHVVAGREWLIPLTSVARRVQLTPLWLARAAQPFFTARMAGEPAVACARDIIAAARHWRPDAVVRECMEFGGALAAEKLGIPSACIGTASYVPGTFPPSRLATILAKSRAAVELPEDPSGVSAYPFYAALMPRQFDPLIDRIPNARYYQDNDLAGQGHPIPEWLERVPDDRPLVYACLGSSALVYGNLMKHAGRMMRVMISALRDLDCTAVVSTGNYAKPEQFGAQPEHIRIMNYVPQKLLLTRADLFVTHAGFASVREATRAGVPMVALPLIGDAPYTARCAVERGIARSLARRELTVERIHRACVEVLSRSGYKRAIDDLREHMLALPDLDVLVKDLTTGVSRGPI